MIEVKKCSGLKEGRVGASLSLGKIVSPIRIMHLCEGATSFFGRKVNLEFQAEKL